MRSAIKLVVIQTILGLSLVLEEVPEPFRHDYSQGYSGPQPYSLENQSPRLLNRQVKVAFYALYKSLLEQVLKGFKQLVSRPDSWSICLFISMCLAFLLERIEAGSQEYLYFAKMIWKDEGSNIATTEDYSLEIDSVVFDRLYRILSTRVRGRSSASGPGAVELLKGMTLLRQCTGMSFHLTPLKARSDLQK